jgi:hypothetical protein
MYSTTACKAGHRSGKGVGEAGKAKTGISGPGPEPDAHSLIFCTDVNPGEATATIGAMAAEAPDQPHPQPGNLLKAVTGIQTELEKAPAPAAFDIPPQPPQPAGANAPLSTASLQTPSL